MGRVGAMGKVRGQKSEVGVGVGGPGGGKERGGERLGFC